MKQRHIRWTAFAAGLCLAGTMLMAGGCGDQAGSESGSASSPSSGASSGESQTVKSALKFKADEQMDLGKKKLTISAWGEPTPEGLDPYFDRRYTLEKRTEERYNVDIEWVSTNTASFAQDVALAFSSGKKYADLMFAPSYYAFDVARLGAVLPLDDYIDYSSSWYSQTANNLLYVDGQHYSYMPDEYSVNSLGYFIVYNETLLEKANCEMPADLYAQGKWDWDAFAKIAEQTTVVTDGEVTQWGVGGSNLLDALCLSNGFQLIGMDTGKKQFSCGLYTDAGTNVLNFLKKLTFDLKACDGNYGGHNSKITFGDSKTAMLVSTSYYPGSFVSSGMPVHAVPMPKGPDAKGYVNGQEMQEWWMVSAISEFTPEQLIQVALDMNDNDPAFEDTYFSEKGKKENFVMRMYDGNVVATEEEAELFYDFITGSNVDTMLNISTDSLKNTMAENIFRPISAGEEPRTVLERVKPVINDALKALLPDKLK